MQVHAAVMHMLQMSHTLLQEPCGPLVTDLSPGWLSAMTKAFTHLGPGSCGQHVTATYQPHARQDKYQLQVLQIFRHCALTLCQVSTTSSLGIPILLTHSHAAIPPETTWVQLPHHIHAP